MKLYHLDIRRKDGSRKQLTGYPMFHGECITMKGKFTESDQARIELRDVGPCTHADGFFQFEGDLICRKCRSVKLEGEAPTSPPQP